MIKTVAVDRVLEARSTWPPGTVVLDHCTFLRVRGLLVIDP